MDSMERLRETSPVDQTYQWVWSIVPRKEVCVIWVFPKMVVPPKQPKMIILVGKPMVVGYHHFRKPPYTLDV